MVVGLPERVQLREDLRHHVVDRHQGPELLTTCRLDIGERGRRLPDPRRLVGTIGLEHRGALVPGRDGGVRIGRRRLEGAVRRLRRQVEEPRLGVVGLERLQVLRGEVADHVGVVAHDGLLGAVDVEAGVQVPAAGHREMIEVRGRRRLRPLVPVLAGHRGLVSRVLQVVHERRLLVEALLAVGVRVGANPRVVRVAAAEQRPPRRAAERRRIEGVGERDPFGLEQPSNVGLHRQRALVALVVHDDDEDVGARCGDRRTGCRTGRRSDRGHRCEREADREDHGDPGDPEPIGGGAVGVGVAEECFMVHPPSHPTVASRLRPPGGRRSSRRRATAVRGRDPAVPAVTTR